MNWMKQPRESVPHRAHGPGLQCSSPARPLAPCSQVYEVKMSGRQKEWMTGLVGQAAVVIIAGARLKKGGPDEEM